MAEAPLPRPPAPQSATLLWTPTSGGRRTRRGRPGQILNAISRARRTAALFGADHPLVLETMNEGHDLIAQILESRPSLRFSIYEDAFFVENTVLLEESFQLQPLLADLRAREIGAIELHAGLEPGELRALVEVLILTPAELRDRGGAARAVQALGVRHIAVGPVGPPREELSLKVEPREAYGASLKVVDELTFQASRDVPLDLRKARLVLHSLQAIIVQDRFALLGVSALKTYDEDTVHHSVNVSILALILGAQLELSRIAMTTLGLAALLHDIGKVRVPLKILTKAGRLTAEEMAEVRRHTLYGAHLLRGLPGLSRLAMVAAFEHHANYDLSGYPEVTARPVPHLFTRIIQVADFYDAATSSRRAYHRAMLPSEATSFILERSGTMFDPIIARVFVRQLGFYPVGSVVELNTGELGVVTAPTEGEVSRPVVNVVRLASGAPTPPLAVDLAEDRGRTIVRALDPLEVGIDLVGALLGHEPRRGQPRAGVPLEINRHDP